MQIILGKTKTDDELVEALRGELSTARTELRRLGMARHAGGQHAGTSHADSEHGGCTSSPRTQDMEKAGYKSANEQQSRQIVRLEDMVASLRSQLSEARQAAHAQTTAASSSGQRANSRIGTESTREQEAKEAMEAQLTVKDRDKDIRLLEVESSRVSDMAQMYKRK